MIHRALKVIRQFHNMKQNELAEKLDISKSYLSEIETGKKPASLALLQKYSNIFDIPVSSLIFFSENIGKEQLSSSKFKKVVASKIVNIMEWFVEKNEKSQIKSVVVGGQVFTSKVEPQKYTGTLVKGISTMHKSNAVPILSKEEAKDHASMRR